MITVLLALAVGTPSRTTTRSVGVVQPEHPVPLGAFLGSGSEGVERVEAFQRWLGSPVDVGRTYLPGELWEDIEGPPGILGPWTAWKRANPAKLLVVNVPMLPGNEDGVADEGVAGMLREGAKGAFDAHFQELARRLTRGGASDAVIVPGWEMNGDTYTSRCAPDPAGWRAYWRRIVAAMRAAPGARFRFDFTATRGRDIIPWPDCYPGDDVVDIIGSDNYDQPEGADFDQFIHEPYGLEYQARFAEQHKKQMSFPEWGMFRNSDDPGFIAGMYHWISTHAVAYETITDYCPHGVWSCQDNPRATAEYRRLFGGRGTPSPNPTTPSPSPATQSPATGTQTP
ncbi:glycosyl hydrolase family 26, partial [Spirillospora sp. NPDC049652]